MRQMWIALVFVCGFCAAEEPRVVSFPSGAVELRGFLWKPEGKGPFPAIVYNHGSEQLPGSLPILGRYFVARGFVFLVPHRRGHGLSPGVHVSEVVAQAPRARRAQVFVDELVAQADDVAAAIDYLATQPFVDKRRLAVGGCSYGGIETLLVAERATAARAALDFAGAAMSWRDHPLLQQRLRLAVDRARVPLYFAQAVNDYSTLPTSELAAEAAAHGKRHEAHVYPRFGSGAAGGHSLCVRGSAVWGADVAAFLEAAFHSAIAQ